MNLRDAQSLMVMAGLGIAVGAVVYVMARGVKGTARDVAAGTASAVIDVAAGTVEGIGQAVGIPQTNVSKGQEDLARGDWWAASFDLPAGDFLGAVWDKVTGK
jgi:hypothetical protein